MNKAEKEIDELLKEDVLPEARLSISYSLISPNGFPVIVTMRSMHDDEMIEILKVVDNELKEGGFTADRKVSAFPLKVKPVVEGENCPKCGSPLVRFTSKDGTKSGVRCSTNKFDFITKTASGCDFVRFDDKNGTGGIVAPSKGIEPATENQMNLLKDKDLWREGMTKTEASKIIGGLYGK